MVEEQLDETAIEKLAWIIAEEFLDTCELLSSLNAAEPQYRRDPCPAPVHMIFAWGNPAVPLLPRCRP